MRRLGGQIHLDAQDVFRMWEAMAVGLRLSLEEMDDKGIPLNQRVILLPRASVSFFQGVPIVEAKSP